MKLKKFKEFENGVVYLLELEDGYLIEITDTFLPFYTKDAIGRKQNKLDNTIIGNRLERWMIGVSTMSGCPVHCKFCATSKLKKWRSLTHMEICDQIAYVLDDNVEICSPGDSKEFKINYTRMGEPFLNIEAVRKTVLIINSLYPNTHHYISTIGIKGSDFSWIEGNITLQISLHALSDERRDWLIPYSNKMTIEELGQIRTKSNLKTTLNLTLVNENDFDIEVLKKYFDPKYFFIKLSPINPNDVSNANGLGQGIIEGINLI
jgi:23S rRNA (adenine2503-C2)-methyltransferase